MPKFNYKITILNALSYSYILSCLAYTIFKWEILSKEEGWGVVAMIGLIAIGLVPLLIDLVLQAFIKKKNDTKSNRSVSSNYDYNFVFALYKRITTTLRSGFFIP